MFEHEWNGRPSGDPPYLTTKFLLWFLYSMIESERVTGSLQTCHSPYSPVCSGFLPGLRCYRSGPGTSFPMNFTLEAVLYSTVAQLPGTQMLGAGLSEAKISCHINCAFFMTAV